MDNTNRSSNDAHKSANKDVIQKEINNLMKESVNRRDGFTENEAWQLLKNKYGNNPSLLEAIFDAYKSKFQIIYKKARKFKNLIFKRYAGMEMSFKDMMVKANKYKNKYKLSDDEFNMFVSLAIYDRSDKHVFSSLFPVPNTKMATTLGYDVISLTGSKLNVQSNELNILDQILKLHGETKLMHSHLILQSMGYVDCAPELLKAKFDNLKHSIYKYVHPVFVAMFGIKCKIFEDRMLFANFGSIVKSKHERKPLMTQPDMDLYLKTVNDPNDGVCAIDSAIEDILKRFEFQTLLYDTVLNLRQGKCYYSGDQSDRLLNSLDKCRHSIYDSPDLYHVKDEGNILRRVLNVFSIRPTVISVSQLATYNMGMVSSYGHISGSAPFASSLSQVTTVPLITHRINNSPYRENDKNVINSSLEDALSQPQWFYENKTLVPKRVQIVHSECVLIFHVPRRYQSLNIARMVAPHTFTNLPASTGGWESLNDTPVNYNSVIRFYNEEFVLKSVVIVEKMPGTGLVVGCTTALIRDETVALYDPQGASILHEDRNYKSTTPFTEIPFGSLVDVSSTPSGNSVGGESLKSRASKRGTLFIYSKTSESGIQNNQFFQNVGRY